MTTWRELLTGDTALDVARLDRALGCILGERVYVEALIDPRGHLFQRLEYVGDSILDAAVMLAVVLRQPWTEPSLALVNDEQQAMVSDHALGRVAARRGLPDVRTFDVSRHRLGDRIEAALGAIWADRGIDEAHAAAVRLVVDPGLQHLPVVSGVPRAEPDSSYEAAARVCGHDLLEPAWFGAAGAGGPARRRLAAVGNAVLEAACSTAQYVDGPLDSEAEMSEERRTATSNATIAERARDLGLIGDHDAGADRRAVADEVQALVGAAAMDRGLRSGLGVAAAVLGRTFAPGPVTL